MSNTNDKPAQAPTAPNGNTLNQPNAGTTTHRKPATDENEENLTQDPTAPDTRKQPTDPNNPQANTTPPTTPAAEQPKEYREA